MYSMACLQALLRPLKAGETRQALAQRCSPMLSSIPASLSLMVSQAANPMSPPEPADPAAAADNKGTKRKGGKPSAADEDKEPAAKARPRKK